MLARGSGIEPATFRSAVKCSNNWAYPALKQYKIIFHTKNPHSKIVSLTCLTIGVDEAWKCEGWGVLIVSWSSSCCSGEVGNKVGDLSAAASPTGQPRPAVSPSLAGKVALSWLPTVFGWWMNPNDVIVAGNVDDGGALALEDA